MLLGLLLASACKEKTEAPAIAQRPPAASTKNPLSAEGVRQEATAFLARWVDAQKLLDMNGYLALYEPRTFRGVKRTNRGRVVEFDMAGWAADRKRMFDKKFEVAAEPLGIETWLDGRSKLKQGMSILRFTQRSSAWR